MFANSIKTQLKSGVWNHLEDWIPKAIEVVASILAESVRRKPFFYLYIMSNHDFEIEKFWLKNSFSKSTPNDPKKGRQFCRSVCRLDRPADRIWPATVFFQFLSLQMIQNVKKTVAGFADRSVRSVRRTEFDRWPFFSPFGSFGVDLEIFFSTKKFWQKKPFNWIFDIMRLIG